MSKVIDIVEDLRNIEELTKPAQEQLVSGTNIKTLNGESLLGSGNLNITQTDVTGNAGTATKLQTARTINGVSFDGSADITITDNTKQDVLVSGANIKTINGISLLGSGDVVISTDLESMGVTATSTELNYVDGVTSAIQTQLNAKQDSLVSGTNIKTVNGTSVLGSGNIDIVIPLNDTLTSTSTTEALTANQGKVLKDLVDTKQNTLVSGTTIKTINSSSILSSGDLALLASTNPSITGSITEQVYNLTGTVINPANGTIQYKTVSANTTFTETLTSGQSVLLRLIGANSYTITFPTIKWFDVATPILTANCVIILWKEQSTLYGAFRTLS